MPSHHSGALNTIAIEAEPEGKLLVVPARLNGALRVRLVLDTGAGTSALSLACARRLGLPVQPGLRVRTPTGPTQMGTVWLDTVEVGPLKVERVRFAAVPLPNDRVEGLLGLDFFRSLGAIAVTLLLQESRVEVMFEAKPLPGPDRSAPMGAHPVDAV